MATVAVAFHPLERGQTPPPKRRKRELMDLRELADFLREETNLLTELPPRVRDCILVTPEALALYKYYLKQLLHRDYIMTRHDYFIKRLPVYLPAIDQVRTIPEGGCFAAGELIHFVAQKHFQKLVDLRGKWSATSESIKAFHALDQAMLELCLEFWNKYPKLWKTTAVHKMIRAIADMKHKHRNYEWSRKYLNRTHQFLIEMQGITTARMLARRTCGTHLPSELVDQVEKQILAANHLPYLPTLEAVRKLWVPRPHIPRCPIDWKRCSKTCPNIMEVEWSEKERRWVCFHQGRQKCRFSDCQGHHDFFPDDPYDTDYMLYRANGMTGSLFRAHFNED
ncbi:MAG: hypothetical protein M1820_005184 [Bogoriella megaspora]|nr:MAG: hypothetical protein M1820_005184 [Bogoriella megaspora]